MIITVLGSGSKANSIVIQHQDSAIMIDAGFDLDIMLSKLKSANIATSSIQALFITHGHIDHTRGITDLNRYASIPVYMTEKLFISGTGAGKPNAKAWLNLDKSQAVLFKEWNNIRIGDFEVTPISVSHDSVSPVGFVVKAGGEKLSIVTDTGELSRKSKDAIKDSSVIMLESNHDSEMLHKSSRPYFLKKRISGVKGHLSNEKSAEVLSAIITSRTSDVILLHLSGECNTPELAKKAAFDKNPALKTGLVKLHITSQNEICRISVTQQPVVLGELSRNSSCSSVLCGSSKP
jgi:phosphoribosyl 1,2-cyclic phosphodiesterase